MDNDGTSHMTPRCDWFSNFYELPGEITIGNSSTIPFRCTIPVFYFSNVLYGVSTFLQSKDQTSSWSHDWRVKMENYRVSLAWILQVFEGQWHPMPTYYYLYSNKNRYVVDMGRTMLKHSGLPKKKVLNCTSVHNILNSLYPVKLPLRPCMAQSPFGLIFGSLMVRHLFIIMLLKKNRNKAPCQFHGQTHKHPFFILFLFDYDLGMSFGQPLDFLFI